MVGGASGGDDWLIADRVRHSDQDAAAARVLAGGADRDVTEIRGGIRDFRQVTTSSFNATCEDLNDLRSQPKQGFTEMRGKLDAASRLATRSSPRS